MTFRSKVETKLHAVKDDKIIVRKTIASYLSDNINTTYISLPKLQMHLLAMGSCVECQKSELSAHAIP